MHLDAHLHFWRYNPDEFGWLTDKAASLRRDFLPTDLAPLLAAASVDGGILVQVRQTLDETRWMLDLAERDPVGHELVRGVVGWVDLCADNVSAPLDEFCARPRFVGVRHIVQSEPDCAFLLRPDFQRGIAQLGPRGLVYELLVYPKHLAVAAELVRAFPNQSFVLDHIAKPVIRAGLLEPWATDVRKLARMPNVACKLSGVVTEAPWDAWTAAAIVPYLEIVLDAFGPDRLLFGTDWPVCLAAASYAQVAELVGGFIATLSAAEQEAILGGNCARLYRLPRARRTMPAD